MLSLFYACMICACCCEYAHICHMQAVHIYQIEQIREVGGLDAKDLAYKDYQNGMKYKNIAEKYDVSLNTVKSWKQRYNWERKKKSESTQNTKNGAYKETEKNTKRKKGAQPGNKNAVGHGAKPGNKNSEKYGFFSKWLPPETLDIVQEIREKSTLEIMYEQIELQYAGIVRAQRLMYAEDAYDWEKHERFMNAQSRAMAALNGLVKQYEEMLQYDAEKEDIAEERRERIEKIKAETKRIKEDKDTKDMQVNIVMSSEVSQYAD